MRALALLGAGVTGLTLLALILLLPWREADHAPEIVPPLVAMMAVTVLLYFAAVRLVLRRALPRGAVWFVLIVAAAIRLPVLFTPPILSTDVYRYVWDGRVQNAGINPYLFVPADPALADLRDGDIYPRINRATYAHTIYPPMAQVVFAAIACLSPTVRAEKTAMVGFEAAAILCALRLLALARLPAERVLIYAWNPLTVWSFACDGHVDAVGIAFLAGALLLRCLRRDGVAGLLLGAAVLVKFLPVVAGPALWRRGGGWRLAAGGAAAVVALYACYAGAGWRVVGFLPGYGAEEKFDDGSGLWLLTGLGRIAALPANVALLYGTVVLSALAALSLWVMTRARAAPGEPADVVMVCGHAAILAAGVMVAITPHYAWYFPWLALPSVVRPLRAVVWLSAAPVLLYINLFDDPFLWQSLIYGPAALLALADLRRAPRLSPLAVPFPMKGSA